MARWPKPLLALAVLGLTCTEARAQEAPLWLQQAMGFLVSACAEHNIPAGAAEIPRSDLPGSLRGHYRNGDSGSYRRLNASETFYLLQVPNPSRDSRAVCAVAVPIGRSRENRLFTLFRATMQVERQVTATLGNDLNLNAIIAGSWILVEVSLHPESRAH